MTSTSLVIRIEGEAGSLELSVAVVVDERRDRSPVAHLRDHDRGVAATRIEVLAATQAAEV